MTKDEIKALFDTFNSHLETEMEYKEELLKMRCKGNASGVQKIPKTMTRHDEVIQAIEQNREKNLLPIIETLIQFVASQTSSHDRGIY